MLVLVLAGCNPTAPQRPSQRKGSAPAVDSTQLALLEMNQQLASAADQQLAQWVQEQPERYALYEGNVWIAILSRGDGNGSTPKENEECVVHMQTYNTEGHLLIDNEGIYRIGKHELPPAVEVALTELYHGGRARLAAPWYTAYGLKGNEYVAPYQNVIIELELK